MKKVIVIGSGILGASTAYHLAKYGAKVTLVDRFDKGQATDAAAGIICPWISQRRNKAWYELVKNGARYYPTLVNLLRGDGETETGYSRVGALSLHEDPAKLEKMAERARKRREDAPEIGEIAILSPTETRKLFPLLAEGFGSVFVNGGARVNGRYLRNALVRAAEKLGANIIDGDAKLICDGNRFIGIEYDDQVIEADNVVVTGGAWAKELIKPLGVELSVVPQKAQIVHLEMPKTDTANWPVIMPPNNQYILSFEEGRIVVGATHEDDVGFDTRVTAGGMLEILAKAMDIAPGLASSTIVETRIGFRPFTPGFLPIMGSLPGFQGILLANGLGASGLTSGPFVGSLLAKMALDNPLDFDISNYDVSKAIL